MYEGEDDDQRCCDGFCNRPFLILLSFCVAGLFGTTFILLGVVFFPVSFTNAANYNAGYSLQPYNCQVVDYVVGDELIYKGTTFYTWFAVFEILELNVKVEKGVTGGIDSAQVYEYLKQIYPLNSTRDCYYGTKGMVFKIVPVFDDLSITGLVLLVLGVVLYLIWGFMELIYCVSQNHCSKACMKKREQKDLEQRKRIQEQEKKKQKDLEIETAAAIPPSNEVPLASAPSGYDIGLSENEM